MNHTSRPPVFFRNPFVQRHFRTGGLSLTPPVEVPSNPPSEALEGSDYSLRHNAMVVASCGFLRGGVTGGQKGGGTGGVKGGHRSVKPLCKSGFQSSDGRCRKRFLRRQYSRAAQFLWGLVGVKGGVYSAQRLGLVGLNSQRLCSRLEGGESGQGHQEEHVQ